VPTTLNIIRAVFVILCSGAGWLVCYAVPDWAQYYGLSMVIGLLVGVLVVLVDILLKGFSLRGLSAITFGLSVGALIAYLINSSPLFAFGDPEILFMSRLGLFIITTYLCSVIALRGKDEFNLVIPYVRFVPQDVETPLVVVDTSALIDGRVARICGTGFLSVSIIIPQFVLKELQLVADSTDPVRQARGRRGLEVLNELRRIKNIDIRVVESEVANRQDADAKLVFLAQSMKAKLLTTDYNLAKMAEFQGVTWLNLSELTKALQPGVIVGEIFELDLTKPGKEEGQALGFLGDGSMVVVSHARQFIGQRVMLEITSVLPSAGGRMVFARLVRPME